MILNDKQIKDISDMQTKSEICRYLNLHTNGSGLRAATNILKIYNIVLKKRVFKRIYEILKKECPVCKKLFETSKAHKKEKTVCSIACSNTYFRSGKNNPNYKETKKDYRAICFEFYPKKCLVCNEINIVEVHHFDENHENNDINNLVPLCPTHHKYWHSRYKNLIYQKILDNKLY